MLCQDPWFLDLLYLGAPGTKDSDLLEEGVAVALPFLHRYQPPNIVVRMALIRSTLLALTVVVSRPSNAFSMSVAANVIDSHLHVWATADEASDKFPYASPEQTPPPQLQNVASPEALLDQMNKAGVDGALIVQPCVSLLTQFCNVHLNCSHLFSFHLIVPISSGLIISLIIPT
mgnify:CR=1 FL=1